MDCQTLLPLPLIKVGANKAGLDANNRQLIVLFLLTFSLMKITIRQVKYLNNIIEQDHRGRLCCVTPPNFRLLQKTNHKSQAHLVNIMM